MRAFAWLLIKASVFTIAVVAALGVAASTGFDRLWERFHFLAFANDFWQLNPARDHLIQMFPDQFWLDVSLAIGIVTIAEALLIMSLSAAYLYATREEAQAEDDTAERQEAENKRKERWQRLEAPPHQRRLWRFGSRSQ